MLPVTPPRTLPPRPPAEFSSPEAALAHKQAREDKDAQVRGVTSIDAMREAIRQAAQRYLDMNNYVQVVLYPERKNVAVK
ncbi:MAG: hypothetical protein RSH52_27495 [Janthinobacterium sp.]